MGISYQCSIFRCGDCGDVYEYEDGKLDGDVFTCKQCLMIRRLMNLNAAEISFSGLGIWDIFRPAKGERIYIGSVLLDLDHPPFFVGGGIYFKYAPGFILFPRGVVDILVDGSHTRRGRNCEPVACEEVLRSDAGNPELL